MAFNYGNDLNSFFRLLDANPALLQREHANPHPSRRAFSPNFDVHETEHEYVLEGELPGLSDKSKVNIEFTENQTLLVRGKIERSHTSPPAPEEVGAEHEASKVHKPTVEDVPDESEKKEVNGKEKEVAVKKDKDARPKYWVTERTIGEFQRTFSFPGSIDVDKVTATLSHGILKIIVPKREKPAGRRIEIH